MKNDLINKLNNLTNKMANSSDKTNVSAEVEELASLTYNICWENLFIEKWILSSESIFNCFKYFSNKKDVEKCDYLAWMLNTYYKGFITERFNEYIKDEKYEMCSKLKNYVK